MTADFDRLQVPAERPANWSENAVCICNAPDAGIAVYAHFSRVCAADDPAVWEGVLAVYLPDGEILVSRSFAAATDPSVADAGALRFACVVPEEHWRLTFDGLARRTTTVETAGGLFRDGAGEHLSLALDLHGTQPAWYLGRVPEGQSWGDFHLEQECRVTGAVTVGGERIAVDTLGFRDHSRGSRTYDTMQAEAWSHGYFPDGRVYACAFVLTDGAPRLAFGFYRDETGFHDVTRLDAPLLRSPLGDPREFSITVGGDFGELEATGTLDNACAFTLGHPIGQPIGVDVTQTGGTVIVEGPATVALDGQTGYGWLERIARVAALDVTQASCNADSDHLTSFE